MKYGKKSHKGWGPIYTHTCVGGSIHVYGCPSVGEKVTQVKKVTQKKSHKWKKSHKTHIKDTQVNVVQNWMTHKQKVTQGRGELVGVYVCVCMFQFG